MKSINILFLYSFGIILQNDFSMIKGTDNLLKKILEQNFLSPNKKLIKQIYLEKHEYQKGEITFKLILPYQKILINGIVKDINLANNNDIIFTKLHNYFKHKYNIYEYLCLEPSNKTINLLNKNNTNFKKLIINDYEYLKNEIIPDANEIEEVKIEIENIKKDNHFLYSDLKNYELLDKKIKNKESINLIGYELYYFEKLKDKFKIYIDNQKNFNEINYRNQLKLIFTNMFYVENINFLDIYALREADIINENYEYIKKI